LDLVNLVNRVNITAVYDKQKTKSDDFLSTREFFGIYKRSIPPLRTLQR